MAWGMALGEPMQIYLPIAKASARTEAIYGRSRAIMIASAGGPPLRL